MTTELVERPVETTRGSDRVQEPDVAGRRRPWSRRLAAGALAVGIAVSSGAAGAVAVTSLDSPRTTTAAASAGTAATTTSGTATASSSLAAMVARVSPSIVSVTVRGSTGEAEGSGVVLTSAGVILTNNHVVAGAGTGATITVTLSDGRQAAATVLGTDPTADLAALRVQGLSGLTPATLGTSSSLKVGDKVVAIGIRSAWRAR